MHSLNELSPSALADAADDNLVTHATWAHRRIPGMRVDDAPDLVVADSGLRCDTFNIVCRARLALNIAPMRIRAVVAYFADVGRPFSWWLTPANQPPELADLLRAAGLERADSEVAMAADLAALPSGMAAPDGLQIRRVRTPAELRDFARVLAAGWTPPDGNVLNFYELAAPVLLIDNAPLWLYAGYLEGASVATAQLTVGGGVAGLYNISTLPPYRRRGIGAAMTLRPLLDARASGYRIAVLQAQGDDGMRLYTRLDFKPFGRITEYKPSSSTG